MGVVSFESTFFADYKTYVFFDNPPRNQDAALTQTTSKIHPYRGLMNSSSLAYSTQTIIARKMGVVSFKKNSLFRFAHASL